MSERRPTDDDRSADTRETGDHRADHAVEHSDDHDDRHRQHAHNSGYGHRRDAEVEERRHEEFGGANLGAAFFGWLVAVAMALLLAGIIGAVAAGVGESLEISQAEAEAEAEGIGLGAGIALVVALMIAYYAGGYVAGRMSRYDGGRQGLAVWVIGLLLTLIAALIGVAFGSQYDVVDRVDLPSIPVPTETLTTGGIITLVAVVVGTLVAAILGGKAGHRYHRKVDRFVG